MTLQIRLHVAWSDEKSVWQKSDSTWSPNLHWTRYGKLFESDNPQNLLEWVRFGSTFISNPTSNKFNGLMFWYNSIWICEKILQVELNAGHTGQVEPHEVQIEVA